MKELEQDELEVLETYRRAKEMKYSDVEISIQDGLRAKLWLTEKRR